MASKSSSTGEFEAAIKNFSKISLEVDSLITLGNADAHKIMNKSMESRIAAISHEASRRLKSFDVEQKGTKSKESIQNHGTMEKLFLEEVELEFDRGVEEQKNKLNGDSQIYEKKAVESKKSESSDEESAESDGTEENEDSEYDSSEDENTEDESTDGDTTDKDGSGEDEDSSENESSGGENTDDEVDVDGDKVDDSGKK